MNFKFCKALKLVKGKQKKKKKTNSNKKQKQKQKNPPNLSFSKSLLWNRCKKVKFRGAGHSSEAKI
jgi:hypothetical protein